jgi:hypothetical protein
VSLLQKPIDLWNENIRDNVTAVLGAGQGQASKLDSENSPQIPVPNGSWTDERFRPSIMKPKRLLMPPKILTDKILSLPTWSKTALGSPIALYASHSLEELKAKKPILLMGGIHGDEPEGVQLAEDTLRFLRSAADEALPLQTLCPWIVIPCLNVDGYSRGTRVNGRGVDLNRNYPSKDWHPIATQGSSSSASTDRYYPGPSAGSELEIQAVVGLIKEVQPRLLMHCHSWKPCIVSTGPRAKKDADRLALSSGYECINEIGYPTPGSLSRYGWHDNNIPVICIEEQDGLSDLNSIWPRFEAGIKQIFFDLDDREGKPS